MKILHQWLHLHLYVGNVSTPTIINKIKLLTIAILPSKKLAKKKPTLFFNVEKWVGQKINISTKLMLTCGRNEDYKWLFNLLLYCKNTCLLCSFVTTYDCTCSFATIGSVPMLGTCICSFAFVAFVLANTSASRMLSIIIISWHCLNFLQIASYKESKQDHQEENTKIKVRSPREEH